MREMRIIAALVAVLVVFVLGAFVWSMMSAKAGPLDAQAVRKISRACGFEAECKIRLDELFDGDWDTFYEFGVGVDQSTMDDVLGGHQVKRAARQRTLVLTKSGHVVVAEHEAYGVEQPLDGQIEFADEHHREQSWVKYERDAWLRVRTIRIDQAKERGSYYVLSAVAAP